EVDGELECSFGRLADGGAVAAKPGRLGPCRRDGPLSKHLSSRLCQGPGLVEQFLVPGVSTTRAQERDHHKREDARRRRGARHPQHGGGGVRRLRPTSLVELEPCTRREQVEAEELEPTLAAVANSIVEVPRRICVAMLLDGNGSERNVVVGDQIGET